MNVFFTRSTIFLTLHHIDNSLWVHCTHRISITFTSCKFTAVFLSSQHQQSPTNPSSRIWKIESPFSRKPHSWTLNKCHKGFLHCNTNFSGEPLAHFLRIVMTRLWLALLFNNYGWFGNRSIWGSWGCSSICSTWLSVYKYYTQAVTCHFSKVFNSLFRET